MKRQGRVQQLFEDGTALVLCTDGCTMECHQCTQCHRETEALIAFNPEGAQLGELVLVRTHPIRFLMAVLMLLVVPIGGFFAGYWLGTALWGAGKVSGCTAFVAGSGIGFAYDRFIGSRRGSGYTVMTYPQNINKGDNRLD